MMILTGIIVSIIFVNIGFSINRETKGVSAQIKDIKIQNNLLETEILRKQTLTKRSPVPISKALSLVINDTRYLEGNSGTSMNIRIERSQDNEDIASHYIDSQYQGIKKLPVIIQVDKSSSETDMGAVLSDIYQLETETDFKANEIDKEGNAVLVKGDVYGF